MPRRSCIFYNYGVWRPLQPGQNPRRNLATHRESGEQRFEFTYGDVAQVLGLSVDRTKRLFYGADGRTHLERLVNVIRSRP